MQYQLLRRHSGDQNAYQIARGNMRECREEMKRYIAQDESAGMVVARHTGNEAMMHYNRNGVEWFVSYLIGIAPAPLYSVLVGSDGIYKEIFTERTGKQVDQILAHVEADKLNTWRIAGNDNTWLTGEDWVNRQDK